MVEGALLRLRPKVMTVSTVVAGLLPIMWSTRTGAEVMKPLATPVLGGMVSSLLHVLVVTPVLFYWIRARALPPETIATAQVSAGRGRRAMVGGAIALTALTLGAGWWSAQPYRADRPQGRVVQEVMHDGLRITLRAASDGLRQGRNQFTIEFRSVPAGALVDAGVVHLAATMPMPGMVMSGGVEVSPTSTPGRYAATAEFGMSGRWQMALRWDGRATAGSTTFEGSVR